MWFMEKINARNLNETEIIKEDLDRFAELYQEICELQKKYKEAILGRKGIAKEIYDKLKIMNTFLCILTGRLNCLNSSMEFNHQYISDPLMAINLILKLANEKENKYAIKKFVTSAYGNFELQDLKTERIATEIIMLTQKSTLNDVDDKISYFGTQFCHIVKNILAKGNSCLIYNSFGFDSNIRPSENGSKIINLSTGTGSDITCYLFDDELKNAVNRLEKFVFQNGGDIKGMELEDLYQGLKEQEINEKRLELKKD